jgi:hypothetical protein
MSISVNYLTPEFGGETRMRDFQHAARLYVDDRYAKAPKVGFLYFVKFNLNSAAVVDQRWLEISKKNLGILVKKIDLPKFNIKNEVANQYNRKTVVQTKLDYNPINIEFHDDNSDITNSLWINYYKHYYADPNTVEAAFKDTKYGTTDYVYGRYGRNVPAPFITDIDIYVLHQQKFTHFKIINPKINDWQHDSLDQSSGSKILQNRMSVSYEAVIYNSGTIKEDSGASEFLTLNYDTEASPYRYGELQGPQPQYSFGPKSPYISRGRPTSKDPIGGIIGVLAKDYINKKGLGKLGPVGYNIAGGVLQNVLGQGGGKYSSPAPTENQLGVLTGPGGVGINIFKGVNTSVDGKIRANPAAIIFPPRR